MESLNFIARVSIAPQMKEVNGKKLCVLNVVSNEQRGQTQVATFRKINFWNAEAGKTGVAEYVFDKAQVGTQISVNYPHAEIIKAYIDNSGAAKVSREINIDTKSTWAFVSGQKASAQQPHQERNETAEMPNYDAPIEQAEDYSGVEEDLLPF